MNKALTNKVSSEMSTSLPTRDSTLSSSPPIRATSLSLKKLLQELDQAETQEEIKLYFLKFADAEILVPSLQDLFEGGSAGRDRDRPWWERRRDEPTEGGGGFGVQGEVHLVADARLNAIMISTSSQNFATIDALIDKLDVNMPDQEWGTRMYKLQIRRR